MTISLETIGLRPAIGLASGLRPWAGMGVHRLMLCARPATTRQGAEAKLRGAWVRVKRLARLRLVEAGAWIACAVWWLGAGQWLGVERPSRPRTAAARRHGGRELPFPEAQD